jgi:hypothetical protein
MEHNIESNFKKGLAVAIRLAKKAGIFILKKIAVALGIPFGAVLTVFLIATVLFFSIYGALPAQVKESDIQLKYEKAIEKYSPEIISDDRAEVLGKRHCSLPGCMPHTLPKHEA